MSTSGSSARSWCTGLAILLGVAWAQAGPAGAMPADGDRIDGVGAPAARVAGILARHPLRALGGGTLSLADLRLDALHAQIARRGGRVVAISIDEDRENVDRFARRYGLRLPIALDGPTGLARELDLLRVPLVIVLDRDGNVAFTSSRSDAAGLAAVATATDQIIAGKPVAAATAQGGKP